MLTSWPTPVLSNQPLFPAAFYRLLVPKVCPGLVELRVQLDQVPKCESAMRQNLISSVDHFQTIVKDALSLMDADWSDELGGLEFLGPRLPYSNSKGPRDAPKDTRVNSR